MVHQQITVSDRERCVGLFVVEITENRAMIRFDGEQFITLKHKMRGLPRGFSDRVLLHLFEALTGQKTALWDEQSVFGSDPRDHAETRRRAVAQADESMRRIEAGVKP